MSGPKPWRVHRVETIQECRVFSVTRMDTRSPRTGDDHHFFGIQSTDWVNVLPMTPEGEVVLVRQYRHGSGTITLETPGGMVDPGEAPAEAAARELLEETGYQPDALIPLGHINPNPALFDNRLHGFLAKDARRVAEVRNESTEETHVELLPWEELRAQIRAGKIDHALVATVVYLYELWRSEG
ncbi:MAG: NUDIX hydrolase [Myxococcota bacterium]